MNTLSSISRWFVLGAIGTLTLLGGAPKAPAQDTTTTSFQHGTPTIETSVRNAEVAYVSGNDLVLKLENGKVEHLVVPDSDVFTIDGKDVSVHELQPGTKLTQTITTTTTPRYVNTVRTIKGKVWQVISPSSIIVSLPDNSNQVFRMPSDAKFSINGEPRHAHELRKGMKFEATIVTDDTQSVVSQNRTVVGQAPPPPLPRLAGVLLFAPAPALQPQPSPVATVTAEHAWAEARLPQTGSSLPLLGILGLLATAVATGLLLRRSATNS
jgi:LPXTG-motif cell wall-anchored protein